MTPSRTPETLTAVQRAQRLNLHPPPVQAESDGAHAHAHPDQNPMVVTKPSKQEQKIMEQARKSLPPLSGPRASATANLDPRSDAELSFSILPVSEIVAYGHNPRQGQNPRYDDLKASIKADGITNILTVTRRSADDKYTPYGGGNTRLQIAKELFAEGDQRFAQLRVIVKEWPGDAQVITAHLVENELRADITFWEKARGVNQFRVELESEQHKPLTAGELNRELRVRGLNYGVKTIQNFAFATEQLAPVGPWLKSTQVNEVTRPKVSALLDLGAKLGRGSALREQLQAVMQTHGDTLRQRAKSNEDLEQAEREPVELDDAALLADLEVAAARELDLAGRPQLEAVLSALASDPRITPDELRGVARRPVETAKPIQQSGFASSTDSNSVPFTAPVADSQPLATSGVQQAPLPGMLAGVPTEAQPGKPKDAKPASPHASASSASDPLQEAFEGIRDLLGEINTAVPLNDVLCALPLAPFGFMVDFPQRDMRHVANEPVRPDLVPLRSAVWKLLAALSYQYDRLDRIPAQHVADTIWTTAFTQGRQAFEHACAQNAGMPISGNDFQMGMDELALVLAAPEVGYSVIKLLSAMEQMRLQFPERMPVGFEPLFDT